LTLLLVPEELFFERRVKLIEGVPPLLLAEAGRDDGERPAGEAKHKLIRPSSR